MTDEEETRLKKLLDDTVEKLGDHFDTVQILCTFVDNEVKPSNTYNYGAGTGNLYARVESAREMVLVSDTRVRCRIRKEEETGD